MAQRTTGPALEANPGRGRRLILASNLLSSRSAELHGGVLNFTTASAESNGSDDSKNENAFHGLLSWSK